MSGIRIAAIAVGLAIMFPLERWAGFQWYSALTLGALVCGCVRYIVYFVRERRYIKNMMDEAMRISTSGAIAPERDRPGHPTTFVPNVTPSVGTRRDTPL